MIFKRISPPPELRPFVKYFWTLEGDFPITGAGKEIIAPDGCVELIFHYGDKYKRFSSLNEYEFQSESILGGQLNTFITLEPTGSSGIIAAKFHPAGAFPFFQFPLSELKNQTLDLSLVTPKQWMETSEKIRNSISNHERIFFLSAFLKERLKSFQSEDKLINKAVHLILHQKGKVTIKSIIKDLLISSKHLERKFNEQIGLSPKEFLRITRFRYSLQLLEDKRFKSLSGISLEAGYYDQAHFIHEFQCFSGTSPQKYIKKRQSISTLINCI